MENTQTESQEQKPPAGSANGAATDTEPREETVSAGAYNSVKADMHRYKDEARKAAEELKKIKDQEMRDKEQWKEFSAAKEREATEWKTKYEAVVTSVEERARISSVREAALKLGLVESAIDDLDLMDLKDVVVERTSTGRLNVIGAKAAAERIKSIRPHWFSESRIPNVNGNRPEVKPGGTSTVTYDDLKKAEEDAKKTGDFTEYKKKLMLFKQKK